MQVYVRLGIRLLYKASKALPLVVPRHTETLFRWPGSPLEAGGSARCVHSTSMEDNSRLISKRLL